MTYIDKKIFINVYRDLYTLDDEKPTKGAIFKTIHNSRKGAISGLFEKGFYYGKVTELNLSHPIRLKKDYLYSVELDEVGVRKLDLMKDANKKEKYLIKKELLETLKEQQKFSKNVNSNIEKLLKILNK